jgi:hypothetical protein
MDLKALEENICPRWPQKKHGGSDGVERKHFLVVPDRRMEAWLKMEYLVMTASMT